MAPPDVPLPVHYHKLGDLLDSVKRGQRFAAASVDDVRSGTARPLLLLPKGPREDGRPASGARKADSSKAGAHLSPEPLSSLLCCTDKY